MSIPSTWMSALNLPQFSFSSTANNSIQSVAWCAPFVSKYSAYAYLSSQDCFIDACQGSTIVAANSLKNSNRGYSLGDQMFRLFNANGLEVSSSENSFGLSSRVEYLVEEPDCSVFVLRQGCYSQSSCSGHISVTGGQVVNASGISSQGPSTPESQKSALVDIFASTSGQNWINNKNWNSTLPVADWFGVQVGSDGCVKSVNLLENNLNGKSRVLISIVFRFVHDFLLLPCMQDIFLRQ